MKGKELIEKVLRLEQVDRVPWVPFVGVHGGKLINVNAKDYLQSTQHIVDGVSAAIEKYNPDGIPVAFDLQIEAEVLGCNIIWAENNPPAVTTHPLSEGLSIDDLSIPKATQGRIPIIMEATRQLRSKYPDIALYGLITGPFTLALHLLGTDIFMKMMMEPEEASRLLEFCKKVGLAMADMYIEAGCDIIAIVDPMTSQIDPMSFATFVTPHATEIFSHIRSKGAFGSFFVCGHAQQNIEAMCECKPDNISIDENIPLDYVKEVALRHKISFGGNIKLTVVLLMGTKEDCQKDALECMDLGGTKGFILAPGCDLPMDTPEENILAISEMVQDPYKQEVVRAMDSNESALEILNMKDYGQADKVVVDIITLDSESCAPCQYMVEAVKKVAPHFEGIVEWREHAIKKMEAVTFMASLMVKNIPTICIDGKIAFVSQIPAKNELIAAIQKRINEKLRLKINSKKSELLVFIKDEEEKANIQDKILKAKSELSSEVLINFVTDKKTMKEYGIAQTPAFVLSTFKVKSQGQNPSVDVLKEWMKEI